MSQPYSQFRAMLAISRASLRAILRSPSAVIFSLGFPLIFILVFGFIYPIMAEIEAEGHNNTDEQDAED